MHIHILELALFPSEMCVFLVFRDISDRDCLLCLSLNSYQYLSLVSSMLYHACEVKLLICQLCSQRRDLKWGITNDCAEEPLIELKSVLENPSTTRPVFSCSQRELGKCFSFKCWCAAMLWGFYISAMVSNQGSVLLTVVSSVFGCSIQLQHSCSLCVAMIKEGYSEEMWAEWWE